MLILKTLALQPMEGRLGHRPLRVTQTQRGNLFEVNAGSLFPALRRLERTGADSGDGKPTENNRRARGGPPSHVPARVG